MKIITWTLRIVILLGLVWLALQNNQMTTFRVLEGLEFALPLIVLLLIFAVFGLLMGLLMVLPKHWALRWNTRKLRKELVAHKTLLSEQQSATAENKPAANTDLPPFTM